MQRRDFLKASAVAAVGTIAGSVSLLSWAPRAFARNISVNLNVVKGDVAMIDGTNTLVFSFTTGNSPSLPGPTIVCQEGDAVSVRIANRLATRIAFKVGATNIRTELAPGTTGLISFNAPAAGTYLYYDDQNNGVNRIMGLAGALVVMPAGIANRSFSNGPAFTRQYKWMLAALDPTWGEQVRANGDSRVSTIAATSFRPRYFAINGRSYAATLEPNTMLAGNINEAALVRALNAGGMIHSLHFHGNHVQIVSRNHTNFSSRRKQKDIVSMFPLDVNDVLFPFQSPPDAWPPIGSARALSPFNRFPQRYPMHCHSEMSQTAGGGFYPHGMHAGIVIGEAPTTEPGLG